MGDRKDTFHYTYSARQQEEIRNIRKKYLPQEPKEDKMEQLRRLARSAAKKGTRVSRLGGLAGCLLLGVGMCCTMVWTDRLFIPGIIIGIVGIIAVTISYPLYTHITRTERERIAPQILKLTEELSRS